MTNKPNRLRRARHRLASASAIGATAGLVLFATGTANAANCGLEYINISGGGCANVREWHTTGSDIVACLPNGYQVYNHCDIGDPVPYWSYITWGTSGGWTVTSNLD